MGKKMGKWGKSLNNHGTTLVEIMVVAGIMSVLVTGMATMMQNLASGQRRMQQALSTNDLEMSIRSALAGAEGCYYSLGSNPGSFVNRNLNDIVACAPQSPTLAIPNPPPICRSVITGNTIGVGVHYTYNATVGITGTLNAAPAAALANVIPPIGLPWPPSGGGEQFKILSIRLEGQNGAALAPPGPGSSASAEVVVSMLRILNTNSTTTATTGGVDTQQIVRRIPVRILQDSSAIVIRQCVSNVDGYMQQACNAFGGNYDQVRLRCMNIKLNDPPLPAGTWAATGGSVQAQYLASGNQAFVPSTGVGDITGAGILRMGTIVSGTPTTAALGTGAIVTSGNISAAGKIVAGNSDPTWSNATAPSAVLKANGQTYLGGVTGIMTPPNGSYALSVSNDAIFNNKVGIAGAPSATANVNLKVTNDAQITGALTVGSAIGVGGATPGGTPALYPAAGSGNVALSVTGKVYASQLCIGSRCWTQLPVFTCYTGGGYVAPAWIGSTYAGGSPGYFGIGRGGQGFCSTAHSTP